MKIDMTMETVRFCNARPYLDKPITDNLLIVYKHNKEMVVECSDELKEKLKENSNSFFVKMSECIKYLKKHKIEYTIEDLTNTTKI